MVSISKNIMSQLDGALSIGKSKENKDELFAELFALMNSNPENLIDLQNGEIKNILDENIQPNDNFEKVDLEAEANITENEIEIAKYLAQTFYKEIGINVEEVQPVPESKSKDFILNTNQKFKNPENFFNSKIENKLNLNTPMISEDKSEDKFSNQIELISNKKTKNKLEIKNNLSVNILRKPELEVTEKNPIKNIPIDIVIKKDQKVINNEMFEKKVKKKEKQIDNKKFSTVNESSDLSINNKVKNVSRVLIPKVSDNKSVSSNINKLTNLKNDSNLRKVDVSNNTNNHLLDLMENNWDEKLSSLIKDSIKNNANKIEIDIKPKNLGKIRLEVRVENESTKIDITAENVETANILSDNLGKINDLLNKEKEFNFLTENKGSSDSYNRDQKKRDDSNSNKLSLNGKKNTIDKPTNNSNHNIDVNA